jgi:hypothetical protein
MIKDYWELRDLIHWRKAKFQLPNLHRRENKKIPHGSYRNRGRYGKYMKIMINRGRARMGYQEY